MFAKRDKPKSTQQALGGAGMHGAIGFVIVDSYQHNHPILLQVSAPGVLRGRKRATKNLQQGGRVVCGSHFLSVFVWSQGRRL